MFWEITSDLISDGEAVGTSMGTLAPGATCKRFALYDDDGELYYRGRVDAEAVDNDDHPAGMYGALQWGAWNAGCTDLRLEGVSIYG